MRCGTLGTLPTLDECRASPALSRELGIDAPSVVSVGSREIEAPKWQLMYGSVMINIFRHPKLLVPRQIEMWEREYDYAGDFYSVVPYLERHPCAIEAREVYERAKALFRK